MTFLDIVWITIGAAFFLFASLLMAAFPSIIIYLIVYSLNEKIDRFDFFEKALEWIEKNTTLLLFVLALIIHCFFLSYEEQIGREDQIRQSEYTEGYKDGYNSGLNEIVNNKK
jgi:hypothetical protein